MCVRGKMTEQKSLNVYLFETFIVFNTSVQVNALEELRDACLIFCGVLNEELIETETKHNTNTPSASLPTTACVTNLPAQTVGDV